MKILLVSHQHDRYSKKDKRNMLHSKFYADNGTHSDNVNVNADTTSILTVLFPPYPTAFRG